jgi:hypothetical protein
MDALIGHTGFVGGNLMEQHRFGRLFNSTNIAEVMAQEFETLVCSAVPATMWVANNNPDADRSNILELFGKIRQIKVDRFVLISTISVYSDTSKSVDEDSEDYQNELAYGRHRREFEELVSEHFPTTLTLRLPALFGSNLKKNFLFDILNPVPSFLQPEAFETVLSRVTAKQQHLVSRAFVCDETAGMWRFERTEYGHGTVGAELGDIFENAGSSAVLFTHADSMFQFYGLHRLWRDIEQAINADIRILNLATEPLRAADIYSALRDREMTARTAPKVMQDMRSKHSENWGSGDGYLYGADATMVDLAAFFCEKIGQST